MLSGDVSTGFLIIINIRGVWLNAVLINDFMDSLRGSTLVVVDLFVWVGWDLNVEVFTVWIGFNDFDFFLLIAVDIISNSSLRGS